MTDQSEVTTCEDVLQVLAANSFNDTN